MNMFYYSCGRGFPPSYTNNPYKYMRFDLSPASAEIRGSLVNVSGMPDSVAIAAASVSDRVRITIEDLTPSC